MDTAQKNYTHLVKKSRHARILESTLALLEWDQETQMPPGASEIRSEQIATLAGLVHKARTSNSFKKALSRLISIEDGSIENDGLSEAQVSALKKWRREYLKETALPASFVAEFAKTTSRAQVVWREAKKASDFKLFAPYLEKIIALCRKKAELIGYQDHPYNALLDHYEEGMTTNEVETVFNPLKEAVPALLRKIQAAAPIEDSFLHGSFPEEKQIAFSKRILSDIGYDMNYGRLDFSTHPFSSAFHPTDSRITTRIHPTSLVSNIFVILHEAGHGLYEMGLPGEHYGSPLGNSISLGIHESQSRWWETRIGQSGAFWKHYFPLLQNEFKGKLLEVSEKDFYRAVNKVEPSFIRVEADEVTYPLHVIIRFELEKDLIGGSLRAYDIPEAWNQKVQDYLGLRPKNNAEGCLQDVHWSMGGFGYFPTYTLGNLFAAQLFNAFENEEPDWQQKVAKGEFMFIKNWLNQKIHRHGQRYTSKELVKQVTGRDFSSEDYIRYLNTKYKEIYKL